MGIFDQINFNVPKTPDSSFDLRLLDVACDHRIRDEELDFNITPILSPPTFSGTSTVYGNKMFEAEIDPDASTTVKTQNEFVNDGNTSIYQFVETTTANPIEQEITVPEATINRQRLLYPPKTNTVTAKEKVTLENGDIIYRAFTDYNLFQLSGQVQFTKLSDAGKVIVFKYLSDKKKIIEKNKNQSLNYKFEGRDADRRGIFTIYGRSLLSTQTQLFIRYKTTIDRCPKCAGTGALNDLNFDGNGRLQLVYDFSKLIQDFFKRFNTQKGSNLFDITEGTNMSSSIGLAGQDRFLLDNIIKSEVVNLLFAIRDKQRAQSDIQGIALGEQIQQINRIDVQSINATDISLTIEVLSKSGAIEQISSTVSAVGSFTHQDGATGNLG